MYVSGHPLDEYRPILEHPKVLQISKLAEKKEQETVFVAGMIREIKPIATRKGEPMAFAVLEDRSFQVELIIFPNVYAPLRFTLKTGALLMVEGKVSRTDEESKIIVDRVWKLEDLLPHYTTPIAVDRRVFIRITKAHQVTNKINQLEKLLVKYTGQVPVFLHYSDENRTIQLSVKYNVSPSIEFLREVGRLLGPNSIIVKEE